MKFAYAVIHPMSGIFQVVEDKERAERNADCIGGYVVELHIVYDARCAG